MLDNREVYEHTSHNRFGTLDFIQTPMDGCNMFLKIQYSYPSSIG